MFLIFDATALARRQHIACESHVTCETSGAWLWPCHAPKNQDWET